MKKRFEIYNDTDGQYWLFSTASIRYDELIKNKQLIGEFDLRNDAFDWLESNNIPRMVDSENGYFEVYI